MSERRCFKDEARPCTPLCTAYNIKELEGTHCLELAGRWATARGLVGLGSAINRGVETITLIARSAMGR